jgi:hypothetical protein
VHSSHFPVKKNVIQEYVMSCIDFFHGKPVDRKNTVNQIELYVYIKIEHLPDVSDLDCSFGSFSY